MRKQKAKGATGKAKKVTVQTGLTDVNLLPLMKKPGEAVGKEIGVIGSHWGSSCPPGDRNKIFKCIVSDFSIAHRMDEDSPPTKAFQLSEMGVDGGGGNSVTFWMVYPMPFLTFYYDTYPEEKAPPAQTVHTPAGDGAPAEQQAAGVAAKPPSENSIYDHLTLVSTSRSNSRTKSKFTCRIGKCGGSVTIFSKSTGPFFKHCRRKASAGCDAHAKVVEELNEQSSRQVQLSSGEFVTVFSFEECFPHHVNFLWMVAGGLPMKLNRRPIFIQYVRGYQPRAVLPHNETVHRLAELVDVEQMGQLRARRAKHIASFQGLPCVGLQIDLWTDRNTGIAYAAIHDSMCADPEDSSLESVELLQGLLHFRAFPFTSHTSVNISTWLVEVLLAEEIPAGAVSGVTPDGASDGQSGVRMVPGLASLVDVCLLHDLQRVVKYSTGEAGPKHACPNQDFKDLLRYNRRVVQLVHQSRDVSDGCRKFQADNDIPPHKFITVVRTNATRWTNEKAQLTRNNTMRPILDQVLSAYRREHADDAAIIEVRDEDPDDSDGAVPRGPFRLASKELTRKEIRFTEDQWNANLEAEAFLTRPAEIKTTLEHRPTVTGAQGVQLMIALKKQSALSKPLEIMLFPQSPSLKHRPRTASFVPAANLNALISTARKEMSKQIDQRFVDKRFSDARLIQIYMSKQMPAAKVLSEDNLVRGKALYLKWLRLLVPVLSLGERTSPRKAQKKADLFAGMDDSSDDEPSPAVLETDRGRLEVVLWDHISHDRIASFKDSLGLVDEFKMLYALRSEAPLHYALFKQVSSHLAHEGNAEETFSLSGRLSNSNGKTGSSFLSTLTRINKNRSRCDPSADVIFKAYKKKHRKLPTLAEDFTDAESDDADANDADDESDGGA